MAQIQEHCVINGTEFLPSIVTIYTSLSDRLLCVQYCSVGAMSNNLVVSDTASKQPYYVVTVGAPNYNVK